jgi:glycosyltransferase involved in cell wall biosynthesis
VRDGKEAILTPVGDERALADAIVRLLSDGDLRRTLAEAARARASAFGIQAWASAVLDVYREVASESAASRVRGPGQRERRPLTLGQTGPDRER